MNTLTDDFDAEFVIGEDPDKIYLRIECSRPIEDVFEVLEFLKVWSQSQLLQKPTNKFVDGVH